MHAESLERFEQSEFARGCGSRGSIRLFEFSESTSANNTVISNSISFTVVGHKGESEGFLTGLKDGLLFLLKLLPQHPTKFLN